MKVAAMMAPVALAVGGVAIAQAVTPIKPVPRFGPGSPAYVGPQSHASAQRRNTLRLGRAGPPGSALASGQVGPNCMGPLLRAGYRTRNVDCPLYLPARPGASEQCIARGVDGTSRGVTVTFLDWNPRTSTGSVDCHLNRR